MTVGVLLSLDESGPKPSCPSGPQPIEYIWFLSVSMSVPEQLFRPAHTKILPVVNTVLSRPQEILVMFPSMPLT
jgi:hypothetical protein